ncbi:RDD family protein [Caulobacter zeae]|uniref:RDD family protein n=1 Tax=Caulobacter zeae TaxID=2055137 RepID=A0A2N5D861_9CAUL|nr:RDD family protein [Caulobacter zeae]PLR22239.1 RDD family protein [Caulobacter zeae]
MSDDQWIYAGQAGEGEVVSGAWLLELFRNGAIDGDTRVRRVDGDEWASLIERLPELDPPAAPPPIKGAWTDAKPHPWRRYLARMCDLTVVGSITWGLVGLIAYLVTPEAADRFFGSLDGPLGRISDILLTLAVVIPGTALMIGLTGLSIGKWLFGIKVVRPNGRPIGLGAAFKREVLVWVRGWGLGVPFVSLYTLIGSYRHLSDKGVSVWDEGEDRVVLHRPMNALQITLMVLGIPLLIAVRLGLVALDRMS